MNPILIAALLGAAKHYAIDQPKEKRQNKLRAAQLALSGYGIQPTQEVQEANLAGNLLSFGSQGAAIDQQQKQAEMNKELQDAYIQNLNRQAQPALLSYGAPRPAGSRSTLGIGSFYGK